MKTSIVSVGVALMVALPLAYGGSTGNRTSGPCFSVNIQNDPVNRLNVRQNCNRNISRTVQAGNRNQAQTIQTGSVNDNKVRQYHYDRSKSFGRMRDN